MKTKFLIGIMVAGLITAGFAVRPAKAYTDVSVGVQINAVGDFYAPLAGHGHWVDVQTYGRCWYPSYVSSDWRPYTTGHWLWTDGGWYWQSDEPWAWATYHYGRWVWDPYYGWLWVPDTVWGPSWVAWREGGGYIGWAPLSPACHFGPNGYLLYNDSWISPSWFVFVGHRNFCHRISPSVIIVNKTIVHKTVNITNIRRDDHHRIFNDGPRMDNIEKVAGRRPPTGKIDDLRRGVFPAEIRDRDVRPPQYERNTIRLPRPDPSPVTDMPRMERGGRSEPGQAREIPVIRGGGADEQRLTKPGQDRPSRFQPDAAPFQRSGTVDQPERRTYPERVQPPTVPAPQVEQSRPTRQNFDPRSPGSNRPDIPDVFRSQPRSRAEYQRQSLERSYTPPSAPQSQRPQSVQPSPPSQPASPPAAQSAPDRGRSRSDEARERFEERTRGRGR